MCDYLKGVGSIVVLLGIILWHTFVELPLEERNDDNS